MRCLSGQNSTEALDIYKWNVKTKKAQSNRSELFKRQSYVMEQHSYNTHITPIQLIIGHLLWMSYMCSRKVFGSPIQTTSWCIAGMSNSQESRYYVDFLHCRNVLVSPSWWLFNAYCLSLGLGELNIIWSPTICMLLLPALMFTIMWSKEQVMRAVTVSFSLHVFAGSLPTPKVAMPLRGGGLFTVMCAIRVLNYIRRVLVSSKLPVSDLQSQSIEDTVSREHAVRQFPIWCMCVCTGI